jgi:hypothetical protein
MPLVCEISIEAYCRPNDVIRLLIIYDSDRLSPKLTLYTQKKPVNIAFSAR